MTNEKIAEQLVKECGITAPYDNLKKLVVDALEMKEGMAEIDSTITSKTNKEKSIEIFGNIYEEIEDGGSESECSLCALLEICKVVKPNLPCKRANGITNRHFVLVNEELNNKEE